MRERENVRLRKEAGDFFPWTDNPILREYKFTNVRRYHDRTSRVLREKFYEPHFNAPRAEILINCATFRYFGTSEFAEAVGWQDYETFDFDAVKEVAKQRLRDRERVFTGAYVITNQGISAPKEDVVVDYFLRALHDRAPALCKIAADTDSWEQVARKMMEINGFGGTGFMTKEVLLDTTYTSFWANQENNEDGVFSYPIDWALYTPIGPGARRGAARILDSTFVPDHDSPLSETRAKQVIFDLMKAQYEFWPREFGFLAPHDIQFQLCEFDKYERVRLGQGTPRSRYKPR